MPRGKKAVTEKKPKTRGLKTAEQVSAELRAPLKATPEHIFEIDGEQISTAEVEERVLAAYKASGHRIGNIKTLSVYYNFAERRAYYVINGKAEQQYVEF